MFQCFCKDVVNLVAAEIDDHCKVSGIKLFVVEDQFECFTGLEWCIRIEIIS